jgi:hypothetical protein
LITQQLLHIAASAKTFARLEVLLDGLSTIGLLNPRLILTAAGLHLSRTAVFNLCAVAGDLTPEQLQSVVDAKQKGMTHLVGPQDV